MKRLWMILFVLMIIYWFVLKRNGIYMGVGTWDLNKEGGLRLILVMEVLRRLIWLIIPVIVYGVLAYRGKQTSSLLSILHVLLVIAVIGVASVNELGLYPVHLGLIIGSLIVFGWNISSAFYKIGVEQ